jgi:peptidoglycan/LPS O-acetylase OafA/YrhL
MTRSLSIYLDLMRVLAALLVLLFHTSFNRFGGAWLHPIFQDRGDVFAQAGSAGVIMFFVLSGFVISWTAATKERTFECYIVNRLARLWSVVIPALVLTAIADAIGRAIYPSIYIYTGYPIQHLALAASFLNQIWFLDVGPLSNTPFWSLCYEWWYYVAFGCYVLIRGRTGWLLSLAALAIMGPKIWLLFPAWLMGVAAYRQVKAGRQLPTILAVVLFLAPLGLIGIFALDGAVHFEERIAAVIGDRLSYSNIFISATMFSVLVALNLFAFPSLERYLAPILSKIEFPVRWVAGATLSIYLYHYPLLHLFGALFQVRPNSPFWMNATMLICTLACCFALSAVTESKKRFVRSWLEALLAWIRCLIRRPSATPEPSIEAS